MPPINRKLRGLDLLNFFTANMQTGFGAYIASYLTIHKWTPGDIGMALSVGTLTSMCSQIPAGALLDLMPFKRLAAAAAIVSIGACALLFGFYPERLPVIVAEILHGFASCMITPAVATITVALVKPEDVGDRLGRNARWLAIGNGVAAAIMGPASDYLSIRWVFWLTAAFSVPAMGALLMLGPIRQPSRADDEEHESHPGLQGVIKTITNPTILGFAACAALFHLSNAAMMPLAAGRTTQLAGGHAQTIIAGAILLPQLIVAGFSPFVGRFAQTAGKRLALLIGFAALPLRAFLLATLPPVCMIPVQALDGVSGAVFGVMLPLVAAELTGGKEGFNLAIGALGLASGGGAILSTLIGGKIADWYGLPAAFSLLGLFGVMACLMVWLIIPAGAHVRRGRAKAAEAV